MTPTNPKAPDIHAPTIGWQCFHCDKVFTDRAEAEEHFGTRQYDAPLCVADQFELNAARKERDEYADVRATVLGKLHEAEQTIAELRVVDIHAPTVERCAEVAENFGIGKSRHAYGGINIAAAIRSLVSDKPQPMPVEGEIEAHWQLVRTDFIIAATKLRESLPDHWHDDAVVDFDDAAKVAIAPAILPYEIAEALVEESMKRAQHLRFAYNPWCVQQLWIAALRRLHNEPGESGE